MVSQEHMLSHVLLKGMLSTVSDGTSVNVQRDRVSLTVA
jgi:hypothetical protein